MKRGMAMAVAAAVFAAGPALAQPVYDNGPDSRPPRAELFANDDYKGFSIVFDGPVARLRGTGLEDRISSAGIQSGTWELCTDDDFRGRCITIDRSLGRMTDMDFDDRISSLRPVAPRDRRFLSN